MSQRILSLAALTVLELSPPEMVEVAARAGYSHVGLRLEPATPQEHHFPLVADADLRRQTFERLRDTGIKVLDVEILRLKPETRVADFDALLAVAENGFNTLFDGDSTTQIIVDDRTLLISGGVELTAETLPEQIRVGLAGEPNPDTTSLRPGILLVPRSSKAGCRAWI